MDLLNFITEMNLQFVAVAYVLGMMFKGSNIPDKWIPYMLGGINIGLIFMFNISTDPEQIGITIVQGILTAGAAVYGNQLLKQSKK